jgi:hypothetical protein
VSLLDRDENEAGETPKRDCCEIDLKKLEQLEAER